MFNDKYLYFLYPVVWWLPLVHELGHVIICWIYDVAFMIVAGIFVMIGLCMCMSQYMDENKIKVAIHLRKQKVEVVKNG